jgi:alanine-synthesizing transaminase
MKHPVKTNLPFPFSRRLPESLQPSDLHTFLLQHSPVLSLMQSNPTELQFDYSPITQQICGAHAAYLPHSCGLEATRETLSHGLQRLGHDVAAECLVCTASTSEAYSYLFKLLCNAGDCVALGDPCYPLVRHLAELEGLRCLSYYYRYAGRWLLDLHSVEAVLQAGAKVLVLISPSNPVGHCLSAVEAAALAPLLVRYGATAIVDEVFAPYRQLYAPEQTSDRPETPSPRAAIEHSVATVEREAGAVGCRTALPPALVDLPRAASLFNGKLPLFFVVDGLSKLAGLPQLKLGWIAVHGEPGPLQRALAGLSFIADAYLSVSAPVQAALPQIIAQAPHLQAQIRSRLQINWAALHRALVQLAEVDVLHCNAGWYATLRVPQHVSEEAQVRALIAGAQVHLHPGYFYDFVRRGTLVTGLLTPPELFADAWQRSVAVLQQVYAAG